MKTRTFVLLFIPGLIGLITVLIMNSSAPEPEKSDPKRLACFAAQMAVKGKIAAPEKARFPSCLQAAGVQAETTDSYVVRSYFEIPDASGIYRQHAYEVSVREEGKNLRTFILSLR